MSPDLGGRRDGADNAVEPARDVRQDGLFDANTYAEPIFFDTSTHAEARGDGGRDAGWEAYRQYGYSIWQFDGLSWQIVATKCAAGAVCGLPPQEAGQYVGEHRKKNCEPSRDTENLAAAQPDAVGP